MANSKNRNFGEVGIYIDFDRAEPLDHKAYGSETLFRHELLDKLAVELAKVPLDLVKGVFETKKILDGVIFEKVKPGIIVSVGFDDVSGVEALWRAHKEGTLVRPLSSVFITEKVLEATGAKTIELRVSVHKEEVEKCKSEIKAGKVPQKSLEDRVNDQDMMRQVKNYQHHLASKMLTLRDELARFDRDLSEFLMILKQNIPHSLKVIDNMAVYHKQVERIKEKKGANTKLFDYYVKCRQSLELFRREMEVKIVHPLSQVHATSETESQQQRKRSMKERCLYMATVLREEYNFGKLRHTDWGSKMLPKEQELFVGLVSVLPVCVDCVVDVDQYVDEYLSVVEVKL